MNDDMNAPADALGDANPATPKQQAEINASQQSFTPTSSSPFYHLFRHLKNNPVQFLVGLVVIIGLFVTISASQKSQETRKYASVPTGTATITLVPETDQFQPADTGVIEIYANTQQYYVDGLQAKLDISGDIPSDFAFQSEEIEGLSVMGDSLTDGDSGKELFLGYITSSPQTPYSSIGQEVKIGEFTFSPPTSGGNFTITFDSSLTFIFESGGDEDVLGTPNNGTYSFVAAEQSPTSTTTGEPTETQATNTPTGIDTTATNTPTGTDTTTTNTPTTTDVQNTNTPTATTAQGTQTPTPTPFESGSIIPNPPFWWEYVPENLRNWMELLYLWIFYFQRTSPFEHLLDGIVGVIEGDVSPTPADAECPTVITFATSPDQTDCQDFPTPCDVPVNWEVVAACPQ